MAVRTISNLGGNWNATTAWDEGAVPIAADSIVVRDPSTGTSSGNITITGATAALGVINFTNYTGTLTINSTMGCSNNVTLASGMTVIGSTVGELLVNPTTINITSNGCVWGVNFRTSATNSCNVNLLDNWVVIGNLVFAGNNGTVTTMNGFKMDVYGSITSVNAATQSGIQGTTKLSFLGTGDISTGVNTNSFIKNNLTINPRGLITIGAQSNNFNYGGTAGNTLNILNYLTVPTTCTVVFGTATYNGINKWKFTNVTITAANTLTMDYFFVGTNDSVTNITSNTTVNYTVTINAGINCVSPFVKVANCTLSRQGSVNCTYKNANQGGNIGVVFGNPIGNGWSQNQTTHQEQKFGWAQQGMRGWTKI